MAIQYHAATSNQTNFTGYDYYDIYAGYEDETPAMEAPKQAVLITIYTLTALVSVISNLLVIIVLSCISRTRSELTVFLINLAVGDVLMALTCIPFEFTRLMLGYWIFGHVCTVLQFAQTTFTTLSIFTNLAIGIDRYWAIVYPLRQRLTKKKAKIVIVVLWLAAIACATPLLLVYKVTEFVWFGKWYSKCTEIWWSNPSEDTYALCIFFITYLIPLVILSCVYGRICATLWDRTTPGNADEVRDQLQLKSKRKIIKVLIAVVTTFALCWLPYQIFLIIRFLKPDLLKVKSSEELDRSLAMWFAINWLAMSSCFVNPIIYGFQNYSFRADLKTLLTCFCLKFQARRERLSTRSYSSRSTKLYSSTRSVYRVTSRRDSGDKSRRESTEKSRRDSGEKSRPDSGEKIRRDSGEKSRRDSGEKSRLGFVERAGIKIDITCMPSGAKLIVDQSYQTKVG